MCLEWLCQPTWFCTPYTQYGTSKTTRDAQLSFKRKRNRRQQCLRAGYACPAACALHTHMRNRSLSYTAVPDKLEAGMLETDERNVVQTAWEFTEYR